MLEMVALVDCDCTVAVLCGCRKGERCFYSTPLFFKTFSKRVVMLGKFAIVGCFDCVWWFVPVAKW